MDLAGKVAVVSGAAKPEGIGHAVALGLAQEGADIVAADLFEDGLASLKSEVERLGRRCLVSPLDVRDHRAVEALVRQTGETLGRIDVLVNAVGGSFAITPEDLHQPRPAGAFNGITSCSIESWQTILDVNLSGAFYFARAAAPFMMRQRSGRMVNFSSIAGRRGTKPSGAAGSGPYSVAKAAIIGLTKQLALELAPYNVTVNCVAPGAVASWRGQAILDALPADSQQRMLRGLPAGRFATVDEVAGMVVALCTDEMSYVSGVTIDINGAAYNA